MKRLDEILTQVRSSDPGSSDASTANHPGSSGHEADAGDEDVCPECGGAGFVRRALPFGHPEFGRAVPCRCILQESTEERQARLHRYSSLGPLSRLTFENLAPNGRSTNPRDRQVFRQLTSDAEAFVERPEGWLLIHGPSGAGKTHVAAAIANRCVGNGQPVLFTVVPDLLDHLRAAYNPESGTTYDALFEQVREAPILVLDDLGSQSATTWVQEKLYQLFNHRYNCQLPTVITTNLAPERFEDRLRMRLTDPASSRVYHVEASSEADLDPLDVSGLQRIREMTFDAFDIKLPHLDQEARWNVQQAYRASMGFADEPENWLLLQGDHGCGKTHLAAAIVNQRRAMGERPLFVVVPDLLDYLRHGMERESRTSFYEVFDSVRKAPLLILDDFGSLSDSGWVRDHLFQLVNYRYMSRLPTVFTVSLDSLRRLDGALLSRLYDPQISTGIEVKAPPYSVYLHEEREAPVDARRREPLGKRPTSRSQDSGNGRSHRSMS